MSASDLTPDLAPEAAPGIRLLPLLPARADMASVVRMALAELDPAAVAVQLPTTLGAAALQAVARLPRISLVLSQEPGLDALVWVAAPADPFAEALRWAQERDRAAVCIDPDLGGAPDGPPPLPDPEILWSLGPARALRLLARSFRREAREDQAALRARGQAYHVRKARDRLPSGELLVLVELSLAEALAEALRRPVAQPLARVRRAHVEVRHLHPDDLCALLQDAPLCHAVYEQLRDAPDRPPAPPAPDLQTTFSRKVPLLRHGFRIVHGQAGAERAERRLAVLRYAAHHARREVSPSVFALDRSRLGAVVWRIGAGSYSAQTQEPIAGWQRRVFFDFSRRHARAEGLLLPSVFHWTVAARGVADDNLAWEVFDVARTYPWQEEQAEIPVARLDGDMLDLGTRKVRFRRRFFRVKRRLLRVPVRRPAEDEDPESWIDAFEGGYSCSHPPEDLVIEDFGRFLQRKAISVLSASNRRSERFSGSMLDGVDLRETLRNLGLSRLRSGAEPGPAIRDVRDVWVSEQRRAAGDAGSVVVIFDADDSPERYPFRMTWTGEHDEESDMAFFATDPSSQVVGPGIMRATYGAFMMTLPPQRVFDVWRDPDYRLARGMTEVVVMSAVDYSTDKLVVHVAPQPPSARMSTYAAGQGKRLVHLPIGTLSRAMVKKIRVVHILAGRKARAIAPRYIW